MNTRKLVSPPRMGETWRLDGNSSLRAAAVNWKTGFQVILRLSSVARSLAAAVCCVAVDVTSHVCTGRNN